MVGSISMAGVCQVVSLSPLVLSETVYQVVASVKDLLKAGDSPSPLPLVDLAGSVAIVTGSNTGIGKETVRGLVVRGATVIMACRDLQKARQAAQEIGAENIKVRKCDLASFASVRQFCQQIQEEEQKIDILVNNAGVFSMERSLTEDNQDLQFQVNHFGHFLLTNLLIDKLKAAKAGRIINVSSIAHW